MVPLAMVYWREFSRREERVRNLLSGCEHVSPCLYGRGHTMTYREVDLGSRGSSRKRVGAAVGGGVVDLGEAEALVVVVGDGEALEEVRELGHDVQERLLSRLEEGGVPGASPAGKLVAFLSALLVFRFRILGNMQVHQTSRYVPLRCRPELPCPHGARGGDRNPDPGRRGSLRWGQEWLRGGGPSPGVPAGFQRWRGTTRS